LVLVDLFGPVWIDLFGPGWPIWSCLERSIWPCLERERENWPAQSWMHGVGVVCTGLVLAFGTDSLILRYLDLIWFLLRGRFAIDLDFNNYGVVIWL
jgi:hypothetical protein